MPDLPTVPPQAPHGTIDQPPDTATVPPAAIEPGGRKPNAPLFGFELFDELGRGGMGVVYRARQSALNRVVALKMVLAGGRATDEDRARFLAEGEAVAALSHPGIVQVHEFGTHEGEPYFALEFCPGGSLAQKLAGTPLPPREAAEVVEKVARSVQHAHERGIVHRDLKPANVLLAADGSPKVTDFGLAKRVEGGAGLTQTGAIMGTPSYMAPEQAAGAKSVGPPADVYALGAILYECLTGRPPFRAATPLDTVLQVVCEEPVPLRQLNPQAPADLETAAHKCLQKEPVKRYASAAALADDLGRWLRGEPIAARPVGPGERLARWAKHNRALAAALTAAAVFLVVGSLASTLFGLKAVNEAARAANLATAATEAAAKAEAGERSARDAAAKLADEKERLDRTLSRSNFYFGRTRWQEGRSAEAAALLDAVRPDDRGFEWGYVKRQTAGGYATLYGHTGEVKSAAFSPDGARVLTTSNDGTAKVWDVRTGAVLLTLDEGLSASFSPDGRRIVTTDLDKTVTVRDARTGVALVHLRGHAGPVLSAAFSPDGARLVTAGMMGTTKVWNADNGTVLHALRDDPLGVKSASFSPDGTRLVTTSFGGPPSVMDARTGAVLFALEGHQDAALCAAFGPDGARLVSASVDGTAKVWDARTGDEVVTFRGHAGPVHSASFSPDGRRIATAGADGARVWDAASGATLATLQGHTDEVLSAAFSPDGGRLVTASKDGSAKLWDLRSGSEFPVVRGVLSAAFSPDGERIFSFNRAAELRDAPIHAPTPLHLGAPATVWDARTGTELFGLRELYSASFSPDSARLVTSNKDGTAKVLDARTGAELLTLRAQPGLGEVTSASFSPDGEQIVTAGHRVRVWDARTGQEQFNLQPHGARLPAVNSASFSPDGRRIMVGALSGTARVWDVRTGAKLLTFNQRNVDGGAEITLGVWDVRTGAELLSVRGALSGSFSPDSSRVVTTDHRQTAQVWDVASGIVLFGTYGNFASFSPDGEHLVVVGGEAARVLVAYSGAEIAVLRGHTGRVESAVYDRDGGRIVTASQDKTVRIWDARTGAELLSLPHSAAVYAASFSPDGRRIIAVSENGVATVWDARTVVQPLTLRGHANQERVAAFSPDGKRIVSRVIPNTIVTWDAVSGKEIPGPPDFPVDVNGSRRHGDRLILFRKHTFEVVDSRPADWELGQRAHRARIDPAWHQQQAAEAARTNDPAAVAFHRGWVATAWPDEAGAWQQLDAACRTAGSPKHILSACDRVLAANPQSADARRRRALYRGSAAAAAGAFAAGWPGLASLADW